MKKLLLVLLSATMLVGCANEIDNVGVDKVIENDIESYLILSSLAKNGFEFSLETLSNGDVIANVIFLRDDNFLGSEHSINGLKNMYNNLEESAEYATDTYTSTSEKYQNIKVIFKYDFKDSNNMLLSEILQ